MFFSTFYFFGGGNNIFLKTLANVPAHCLVGEAVKVTNQ